MFKLLKNYGWILVALILILSSANTRAATDSIGVTLPVTTPAGGGGGPPDDEPVPGCTDPAATNYNSQATIDNGSCEYPMTIPNVTNFSANYSSAQTRVNLTWSNPSFAEFTSVRVVRQTGSIPSDPNDGLLIYDGAGESVTDAMVAPEQTYFYVAFVRAVNNNYSSGVVTSVSIPKKDEEPPIEPPTCDNPPCDEPPGDEPPTDDNDNTDGSDNPPTDDNDNTDGSDNPPIDPFTFFPEATDPDPLIQTFDWGDLIFFQPGERQHFFRNGGIVSIIAGKDLSVLINYERLPETLKTIGLTIVNPSNSNDSRSFILRINDDKTAYLANLGIFQQNGLYPIYVYVINFKNQTIKHLAGKLLVTNGESQAPIIVFGQTVARVSEPILTAVGLGAGFSQALSLTGQINSFSDIYFFIIHFWTLLLRMFGLRRRRVPWGVVYDSVTKRPLDPAYVIAKRGDDDTATAITDLDGRYGFFLPAASYTLTANKTHYRFPSTKLQGKSNDELYDHLYFGEPFATADGEVINRNIPLDPVAFDWNEFAKQQQGFFILHTRRERRRAAIYNTLFGFGLVVAFYQLLFRPSVINLILPFFYAAVFSLKYVWRAKHPITTVRRRGTGLPIPFAVVRAYIPSVNQQVKSVVADMMGRFFLLTPPGEYYITVEEKLPDESYQKIYQSENLKLDKGILIKDLVI